MNIDIRTIVFDNLNSAKENGAFQFQCYLYRATAEEVADDMVALAEDCEGFTPEQLLPHIREWLAEHL